MIAFLKQAGAFLWQVVYGFLRDACTRMAAAISYYTIFSLPPLVVLLILLLGWFVDSTSVEHLLSGQFGEMLGPRGAEQVRTVIDNATIPGSVGSPRSLESWRFSSAQPRRSISSSSRSTPRGR